MNGMQLQQSDDENDLPTFGTFSNCNEIHFIIEDSEKVRNIDN